MQICKKCSSIVSKLIENTAEWRFYGNDDNRDADPSRCGLRTNNLLPFSSIINIFFRYSGDIIITPDTFAMKYKYELGIIHKY